MELVLVNAESRICYLKLSFSQQAGDLRCLSSWLGSWRHVSESGILIFDVDL